MRQHGQKAFTSEKILTCFNLLQLKNVREKPLYTNARRLHAIFEFKKFAPNKIVSREAPCPRNLSKEDLTKAATPTARPADSSPNFV
jgi:hypothetical protein